MGAVAGAATVADNSAIHCNNCCSLLAANDIMRASVAMLKFEGW